MVREFLHLLLMSNNYRETKMPNIIELLDLYHVDEFDDLLIEIIKHMKEQKETRQEGDE